LDRGGVKKEEKKRVVQERGVSWQEKEKCIWVMIRKGGRRGSAKGGKGRGVPSLISRSIPGGTQKNLADFIVANCAQIENLPSFTIIKSLEKNF